MVLFSVAENAGLIKGILTIPAVVILACSHNRAQYWSGRHVQFIGERIFPDLSMWKQILWGTVCLSFACAFHLWAGSCYSLMSVFLGIGAVILGFFQREK